MKKHKNCLICNSNHLKQMDGYYAKHQLIKCKDCSFVFMENIPSLQELDNYYSAYSYASESYLSPITIKSYNSTLDEFEKFRKTNKILDVGCGNGWFLEEARKRGWEVYGTEYSETAIKICKEKGIEMIQGQLLSDTFSEDKFDVITSFEVLEHINNPIEDTSHIYSFLRKGGQFYVTTPNFNSLLRFHLKQDYNVITYPEHLSYYTKKTINKLFKNQGFKKVKLQTTGISITRFKASKKNNSEELISEVSADEKLRQKIDSKPYLEYVKKFVNYTLSLFGIGMTLKAYYIKK